MPVRRRLLAVGLWLLVTGAATAIVWAGTSTVAADLTDRPAPLVDHREVVEALQPGPTEDKTEDKTEPGITTPAPGGPTTTVSSPRPGSETIPSYTPVPPPSGSSAQPPSAGRPTPAPTPPTTRPASPPTTAPPGRPTATYSTAGGVARVACTGPFNFLVELVSATPNNGYAVRVVNPGPYYVEVHFVRPGRVEPLWAYCLGEPMRAYGGPPQ